MRKIPKAKQKEFYTKCLELLKNMGAVTIENAINYTMYVETSIGKLYLKLDLESDYVFSLFGNFLDDPNKAKDKFGHWKYNLHLADDNITDNLKAVKFHINLALR